MDKGRDQDDGEALFSEANAWFFRLQSDDVTPDEKRAFAAWLDQSPAHVRAWNEMHALMAALHAPARASYNAVLEQAGRSPSARLAGRDGRGVGRRTLLRWMAGGVAVAAVVVAGIRAPILLDRWGADYMTVAGEREAVTLADGTRAELDTDTVLKVDITSTARRITVVRGEAFFDVAGDARPFIVMTSAGETRDIGTAFSVAEGDGQSTATVESGIVDVSTAMHPRDAVRVTAGQTVDFNAERVSPVRAADLEERLAWRRGQLVFRQQPLSEVVAKLNRYRSGRIVILNPWISDLLVSGSFNVAQPDAAIEALEGVLGITATTLTPYLVMLR